MNSGTTKDSFLPDQTTQSLAEQTNACLQEAVRRDGAVFVEHLDGFIVALREEMVTPGGFSAKHPPAVERTAKVAMSAMIANISAILISVISRRYRIDVAQDGTGIERPGWFRSAPDAETMSPEHMVASRFTDLHWVFVLYESVVPDKLKADVSCTSSPHFTIRSRNIIISTRASSSSQSLGNWPTKATRNYCLQELGRPFAEITVPVQGEDRPPMAASNPLAGLSAGVVENEVTQEFSHDSCQCCICDEHS